MTKYAVNSDSRTSSNYQMSVTGCCWHWQDTVLAAGCQRVISIYRSTCCEMRFIQLVTIFVTQYCPHSLNPLPLSTFVRTEPYPPPPRGRPVRMTVITNNFVAVWCSGNALDLTNAVALHRARLVLGWVTAYG